MIVSSYSKEQVGAFKGFGILLIVFHNFYHSLSPKFGENQFGYRSDVLPKYIDYLIGHPADFLPLVFSYLGHYGVQIFIFFSVYGLAIKYKENDIIKLSPFIINRFVKIYPAFILAIIGYLAIGYGKSLALGEDYIQWWDSVVYKVLLVSNFIPWQALKPVGPWWFLPFIFTLYILFPYLLKGYKAYGNKFLVWISIGGVFLEALINLKLSKMGLNLNHIVIGYLPIISLGLYFANRKEIVIRRELIVVVFLLFILGNMNQYIWILSGVSFMLITMVLAIKARSIFSNSINRLLMFYGGISMYLFLINGFLRYPFQAIAKSNPDWLIINSLAIASLLVCTIASVVFKVFEQKLIRLLKIRG